jgi:transposase
MMPQAEIVADRFHVMKQVNQELNAAIKKLKSGIKNELDEAKKAQIVQGLAQSKYALLKNEEDLTEKQKGKLLEVKKVAPLLGEKHQKKEEFREIFDTVQNWVEGLLKLGDWLRDAAGSLGRDSYRFLS